MLSCLVPSSSTSRFGQEDNIINQSMPSSPAFTMQFPSLASSLHHHHHHHHQAKGDDENSTGVATSSASPTHHHHQQQQQQQQQMTTDFWVTCPQCHIRLNGFESLRNHIENVHPHNKLNIEPSFPSPREDGAAASAADAATDDHLQQTAVNHSALECDDNEESNFSTVDNKHNISNNNNNSYNNNNNNNNSQEKNNNSISSNNTQINSAPNSPTPPHSVHHLTQQQQQQHLLAQSATNAADLTQAFANSHLPHNLHPAAAAQFMAALAMQQQVQQNGHLSHPAHHGLVVGPPTTNTLQTHHQQYDLDTMRSTSSPGSTGGSDNNSAASSLGGGPYQCMHCSMQFQNRLDLEKHEIMHSPNSASGQLLQNGVNLKCKICHKAFANVYRLQRHMISHDESALLRKFKCNQCDKAFKFKHHLKEHIRIHSGEKPFGCDNCGKRFSHSGSFSSHMTSKKCISMGLKLNNGRNINTIKLEKNCLSNSPNSKQHLSPNGLSSGKTSEQSAAMAMNYFAAAAAGGDSSAAATNPNPFYSNLLPKYGDYNNAMNAAILASFPHPFYSMALDPRIHPYSIQRLLELTAAGQQQQQQQQSASDTPPLQRNSVEDHEDKSFDISAHGEEDQSSQEALELNEEDNHEDEPKLVMDLDESETKHEETANGQMFSKEELVEKPIEKEEITPLTENTKQDCFEMPAIEEKAAMISAIKKEQIEQLPKETEQQAESAAEAVQQPAQIKQEKTEDLELETTTNEEKHTEEAAAAPEEPEHQSHLRCRRCDKQFNHPLELVQHEKVLCGLIKQELEQQYQQQLLEQSNHSNSFMASSDTEDVEDERDSISRNDCSSGGESNAERKVRIRTAITEEQQQQLKQHYAVNARPSREEFRMISSRLQLDARVVQVWFQNNRSRERKMQYNNAVNKVAYPQPFAQAEPPIQLSAAANMEELITKPTDDLPLDLSVKPVKLENSKRHSPLYGVAPMQNSSLNSSAADFPEAINLSRKMSPSSAASVPSTFNQQAAAAAAALYFAAPSQANGAPNLPHNLRQTPSPIDTAVMSAQQTATPRGASGFPTFSQLPPYMMHAMAAAHQRSPMPMEALFQMTPGAAADYARQHSLMNSIKLDFRGNSLSPGSEKRSWRDDDSRISHEDDFVAQAQAAAAAAHAAANLMPPKPKRVKSETHGHAGDPDLPFICDQCDKAFAKQSSLARHKYEHSGQRPYQCMDCPKAFKHKHHLTEHKRLHSGEKPFQCSKCLKRFSHSGSYSQHMNHRYSYCKPYRE